jgi:hypothetical protein
MKRSIVTPQSLEDLLKMDQALRTMRIGIQLAEAMAEQAIIVSQREAIVNRQEDLWTHALIERFPANSSCKSRKEIWIMFEPGDPTAKRFHSYPYWKKYFEKGETILCLNNVSSWNILHDSDIVHRKVKSSELRLTEWDMKCMTRETAKKFGL